MRRVGILGFGFMGRMHFRCYKQMQDIEIVVLCDIEPDQLTAQGEAGNVAGAEESIDLSSVQFYTDFDTLLKEENLDAVSIALPTSLHSEYTVKALEAGLDVLCEKPMAPSVAECEAMIAAAQKNNKILQVGHCIRFWPEYAVTKEIIDSGQYGKVKAISLQRFSLTPTWSEKNWILDGSKSGGATLDLHIHDADYVQYLFGLPRQVYSSAVKGPSGDFDHIVTQYHYGDEKAVVAEGGWMMTESYGFKMSFDVVLEKAVITFDCTREPSFKVHPADGEAFTPEVPSGDGYSREIEYFAQMVSGKTLPTILTPDQSRDSVRLVLAEIESARTHQPVSL